MREPKLDPAAILTALGVTDVSVIERVHGGMDTDVWRVERAEGVAAMRVFRPEQRDTARREVAAMRAAAKHGLPVPAVQAHETWHDRSVLLLDWCEGRTLLPEVMARPELTDASARAFGLMQARIHATPAPTELRRHDDEWLAWAGPDEAALHDRLRALDLRGDALLHFDYHPNNVLFADGRVTGVLDWANATAGDPRADVARTYVLLRFAPSVPDLPPEIAVRRDRLTDLWRAGYERERGPLGDLTPFYAWAGAMTVRDLAAKIGRPGITLQTSDLDPLRRQVEAWKRGLGLSA
jgi:aminoglycoside phosphotransferase (APT) family kinase protein